MSNPIPAPPIVRMILCVVATAAFVGCSSVNILQPADGDTFSSGQAVAFEGEVTRSSETGGADRSDDLEWGSSRDGALGTGRTLSVSTLSVGVHKITATWPSKNRDESISVEITP